VVVCLAKNPLAEVLTICVLVEWSFADALEV
jgi:hypothetical protein